MRERLQEGKAEQERRALQAARRAEKILSASSSQMRRAERKPREADYRSEMLKWRIEGGGLRACANRLWSAIRSALPTVVPPRFSDEPPHDDDRV